MSNSTISLDQLSSRKNDDLESSAIIQDTISKDENTKAEEFLMSAIIQDKMSEDENTKAEESLMTTLKNAFENDDILIKLRQSKLNEDRKLSHKSLKKRFKLFIKDVIIKNNLLYLKDKLIVLTFDSLRLRSLRRFHESFIEEHLEYKTMFHAMSSSYF